MMRALDDLVRAGKVLYVGISDAPAWVVAQANTLADWRSWTPFVGVQLPYSLVQRDGDRELLPMAEKLGVAVAAWSPLGRGLLSGKYSRSTRAPRPRVALMPANSAPASWRSPARSMRSPTNSVSARPRSPWPGSWGAPAGPIRSWGPASSTS